MQLEKSRSDRAHYVYVHERADTGIVFYVGKGANKRAWSKSGRNQHWHRTVAKYGYSARIVMSGMHEICALSMESALIKFYGRDRLCNLTDGGDIGPTGMKKSEDSIRAHSERMMGNQHTKGRNLSSEHIAKIRSYRHTDESRAKISEAIRARGPRTEETKARISAANKGRVMSPEWRKNNSEAQKRRPPITEETRAKLSSSLKGKMMGDKNPSYGVPKTPEQKEILRQSMLGRRFSEDTLLKRSGVNHPRYDNSVYTIERNGVIEVGTRHELAGRLYLRKNAFTSLLNGSKKTTSGWRIVAVSKLSK